MKNQFDGKKYQKASAHQKEWGERLIAELALEGWERVLDLGCGDGVLTRRIADLVPQGEVVGVDSSEGMIETASAEQRDNLTFVLIDIDDLDFTGEFDVIFSNAALHWVKDHKALLENSRRALRSNGRLRFNFAGQGNCSGFFAIVREAMAMDRFAPYFVDFDWPWYMPSVDEYRHLVDASGLRDVQVWDENADRYFPNADTMIRWIEQPSLVAFLSHVPPEASDSFRDFVVGRMIEETREEDGRCFETFRRINVAAAK